MATERTKVLTQRLYSTRARIFQLPKMTRTERETAQGQPFASRALHSLYRDSRGVLYAHDGVSIRRLTSGQVQE